MGQGFMGKLQLPGPASDWEVIITIIGFLAGIAAIGFIVWMALDAAKKIH